MLRAEALGQALEKNDSCEIAQVDFWDARREFERYKNLVYVMACVFAVFLVAGIVLIAAGSDTRGAGIVSFVGTVASGVAMNFIIGRRNQASKDKTAAAKLVHTYCDSPEETIERLDTGASPIS